MILYLNGQFVTERNAKISVFDRGLLFGDGVYEVIAVVRGSTLDETAHLRRLRRSLGMIGLEFDLAIHDLSDMIDNLIARNHLDEGIVYVQVTRR